MTFLDGEYKPAFTKGGRDGKEIWPCIIEKAYAKWYSSYSIIESGKIPLALSDMNPYGVSEQMPLKDMANSSADAFWKLIQSLGVLGKESMLGGGSPEHPDGDSAISPDGIVMNHAYAILKVKQYESEVLVQLRNPHGATYATSEWNGDWADDSVKWTNKAKNQLKYDPNEEDALGMSDGIFWMDHESFIANFKYLYICRVLSPNIGWNRLECPGKWEGKSCGYPGKPMLVNVPQYKLTIHSPQQIMIELKQTGASGRGTTTFKGKNHIAFMLSDEDGNKMTKLNKQNVISRTVITDLKILTNPVTFGYERNYPRTYTLLAGTQAATPQGEGTYKISVYSKDEKTTLVPF
jgi:hypothetical protein